MTNLGRRLLTRIFGALVLISSLCFAILNTA